jgi:hypothetical protein
MPVSQGTMGGGGVETELGRETGKATLEEFAEDTRASRIVGLLNYTTRLLLINRGASGFQVLLNEYFDRTPADLPAFREADAFAEFLRKQKLSDANLYEVVDFELGLMRMHANSLRSIVRFGSDPGTLFTALAKGRLPEETTLGQFQVVLDPRARG